MSETYNLFQQGRDLYARGMAAQATVALEKARKREPDKASIRELLGRAYFRIRRYAEAEVEFRAMLELSPADDYAHYALGRCLEKQGRETEANGHYKLARSLRPGSEQYASRIRDLTQRLDLRAVVQRVSSASVMVDGALVGEIGAGLVVLLGVAGGDGAAEAERLARRVARLRIFENTAGNLDRSLVDVSGDALVVSQFTLIADTAKGNRPSFAEAARPEVAEPLYEAFREELRRHGVPVEAGAFGARMQVELVNDGPVTIVLDS